MVKFTKNINEYKYILSFDLAKFKSGYTLYCPSTNSVPECGLLSCSENEQDSLWAELYDKIRGVLELIIRKYGKDSFFVTKEKLPVQNGKFTTIDSLQSLAKAHAIFELACVHCGVDVYDFDGVHSVSVKAYIKRMTGIEKPSKDDIKKYLVNHYAFIIDPESYDVTDSLACSVVLYDYKWNKDICDKIALLKKAQKAYKTNKKKLELQKEVDFLTSLLKED